MQLDYINLHFKMGLTIKKIMEETSINYLEIDIADEKILLFPCFTDNKGNNIEWFENSLLKIKKYSFSNKDFIFVETQQTLNEFTVEFLNTIPMRGDINFLNYLSSFMKKDIDDNYSFSFYKHSIGENINKFWGNNIKAFLLKNKLDKKLPATFKESIKKI